MIVRRFLRWVRSATPGERADATGALARAFLHSDLSADDRRAAEAALLLMLDDPAPMVRRALAEALGSHPDAPHTVIVALAHDEPDIAACVLAKSPVLIDVELIECAAGAAVLQAAIAGRPWVPATVSAALGEVGSAESCLILLENPGATLIEATLARIVERFGHLGAVKEALIARDDLPPALRQALAARLAGTLQAFVTARAWLDPEAAERVTREACERATVRIADGIAEAAPRLVRHLRDSGQLTAGLLLRALLAGNRTLFEAALVELTGLAPARVAALVEDRTGGAFTALYSKAGLPDSAEPMFRAALSALHEVGFVQDGAAAAALRRRMVQRVLTGARGADAELLDGYIALLRRYAVEAAREEARAVATHLEEAA